MDQRLNVIPKAIALFKEDMGGLFMTLYWQWILRGDIKSLSNGRQKDKLNCVRIKKLKKKKVL